MKTRAGENWRFSLGADADLPMLQAGLS